MDFGPSVEVRARGMAIAVEMDDDDSAGEISDRCRSGGLLLTTAGNALTMFPPLTLDRRTAKQAMDILERAIGH